MERWYLPDARDREIFGDAYDPPERFEQGAWHLVATYPKSAEHGQTVELYESRYPARFFRLLALPGTDRDGAEVAGYCLSTGSGADLGHLMVQLATAAGTVYAHGDCGGL